MVMLYLTVSCALISYLENFPSHSTDTAKLGGNKWLIQRSLRTKGSPIQAKKIGFPKKNE